MQLKLIWHNFSFSCFAVSSLQNSSNRWKKSPRGLGKLGTCALQNTGILAHWSLCRASFCILLLWFMLRWSYLSVTKWNFKWLTSYWLSRSTCTLSVSWLSSTSSLPRATLLRILERWSLPKAKARATDFLSSIGPEAILQLAMMRDAAQEEMELNFTCKVHWCHAVDRSCGDLISTVGSMIGVSTEQVLGPASCLLRIRFCDRNTVDVAQLRQTMDTFLSWIGALFLQRKAAHIHCYTQHVTWCQILMSSAEVVATQGLKV